MLVTIYKISCDSDPDLFYVGSTQKTIQERFVQHYRNANKGSDTRFHRIMRQKGLDNWTIEEICSYDVSDRAEGYELEYEHIKELRPPLNVAKSSLHSTVIAEQRRKQQQQPALEYIKEDPHRFRCCCGFFVGNPEVFMNHIKVKGRRKHTRVSDAE